MLKIRIEYYLSRFRRPKNIMFLQGEMAAGHMTASAVNLRNYNPKISIIQMVK